MKESNEAARVVMVVHGRPGVTHGGAPMRWSAVSEALGEALPLVMTRVACNRGMTCREGCWFGGETTRPGGRTDPYRHLFCAGMLTEVLDVASRFAADTIVFSDIRLHAYLAAVSALESRPYRIVFDMHNVQAALHEEIQADIRRSDAQGTYAGSEINTTLGAYHCSDRVLDAVRSAEAAAVRAADEVWACSADDVEEAVARYPDAVDRFMVVPNCVPTPRQRPAAGVDHFLFLGRLDYWPNIAAARLLGSEIVPAMRDLGVTEDVLIAGADPMSELRQARWPSGTRLVVDPATTSDLLAGAAMLVPLSTGGGSRLKILEAFASAVPVVSTPKGMEGIGATDGVHYLSATTPEDFAKSALRLVSDPGLVADLTGRALELVRREYSIDALRERLRGSVVFRDHVDARETRGPRRSEVWQCRGERS